MSRHLFISDQLNYPIHKNLSLLLIEYVNRNPDKFHLQVFKIKHSFRYLQIYNGWTGILILKQRLLTENRFFSWGPIKETERLRRQSTKLKEKFTNK
jgi:hypothetical protein